MRQMSEVALVDTEGEGLATSRTVRLRVPARPEYIALARLALSGLADLAPLSEEDVADLKLALTEAVSNSVRHAYPGGEGFVSVAYELSAAALEIEVVDDGAGFDPAVPPRLDGEELSEGGLGIAIIRTVTDELEITSRLGERGSRIRFVKRLQPGT
jgi:serine/threonine-protein kinase RsbW